MYKIFLDQHKIFQCNVKIEGAALDKSEARLFLESENFTLTFKGDINADGTVKIPIHKLKGILKENVVGKISLEVIAEDTVFKPWESEYSTDISKKVEVNFNESKVNESVEPKQKMTFSMVPDEFDTKIHLNEIFKILSSHGVNKSSLLKKNNQVVFDKLVETYCKINYINDKNDISNIKRDLLHTIK